MERNLADEVLRWVCGFANAQGGRLLLGVNDQGQVVGLPDAAKLLEDLPNKVRDLLGIDGIVRVETFPVPRAALREALLNALVHRDYAVTAPVQIRVYENRLRMWNPAVLPEGWTLDTLLSAHSSSPYNPAIANAFFRAGEIEAWGRGVERIFAACEAAGSPKPVLRYDPYDMWLEFPFDPAYLKALRVGQGRAEQVGAQVTPEVTPEVGRMLKLVKGDMSRAELMRVLGLRDEKHFRMHYQQAALALGVLEMTVPDKPQSRLQKYRLTQAGQSWVAGQG
jgi:ATP-dependent DNA helicase RecG